MADPASTIRERVAAFMRDARQSAGGGEKLAEAMFQLLGRRYDKKSISNWATRNPTRRYMPSAEAFVAAALASGLSMDAYALGHESITALLERQRADIAALSAEFQGLKGEVKELKDIERGQTKTIQNHSHPRRRQKTPTA